MNFIGRLAVAALVPGLLVALLLIGFSTSASDSNPPATQVADTEVEDFENSATLTGREIYRRFLANKYRRGTQELRIVSSDPGGSRQTTEFEASLEDHRDAEGEPVDGLNASVLIQVSSPFDMRHTRYLMVSKEPGPDDEFVYQPSNRRVRRVDLKRTPLLGTDYTFDDLAYHDIDGADYKRLPDEVIASVPVFVVEAVVVNTSTSKTHRSMSYIEQEHYIPVRVRYWDEYGVEIKELTADVESIQAFDTMWVATRSKMRDLLQGTTSESTLLSLDTEPEFASNYFSVRKLSQGR